MNGEELHHSTGVASPEQVTNCLKLTQRLKQESEGLQRGPWERESVEIPFPCHFPAASVLGLWRALNSAQGAAVPSS